MTFSLSLSVPLRREALPLQLGRLWLEVCQVWRADTSLQEAHGTPALPVSPVWARLLPLWPPGSPHEETHVNYDTIHGHLAYCSSIWHRVQPHLLGDCSKSLGYFCIFVNIFVQIFNFWLSYSGSVFKFSRSVLCVSYWCRCVPSKDCWRCFLEKKNT